MTNLEALAKKARSDNERLNMFMDGIEEFIGCLQKTKLNKSYAGKNLGTM